MNDEQLKTLQAQLDQLNTVQRSVNHFAGGFELLGLKEPSERLFELEQALDQVWTTLDELYCELVNQRVVESADLGALENLVAAVFTPGIQQGDREMSYLD
ncbi:hypothetical protein ACQ4M3_09590 [Leptolyngbya sp. AN03gr2]|uniref:hypothetical protein n=1 Tax=Leptolyngbya sp. AN03gr2 TaxID=3423364 RepID=UPI003D315384